MSKYVVGILLCLALCFVFADEIIAEWDFTKGEINSVDGKFQFKPRGFTKIEEGENGKSLKLGLSPKTKPEGIQSVKKYPELTPKGAFRLEFTFSLGERSSDNPNMCLWDNKYLMVNNKKGVPEENGGLMILLYDKHDNNYVPYVCLGNGEETFTLWGAMANIPEGKVCSLAFEYDGKSKYTIEVDGKVNKSLEYKKVLGSLGDAAYPLVIGDRYNSTFCHLDGTIQTVKLINKTVAEAK